MFATIYGGYRYEDRIDSIYGIPGSERGSALQALVSDRVSHLASRGMYDELVQDRYYLVTVRYLSLLVIRMDGNNVDKWNFTP